MLIHNKKEKLEKNKKCPICGNDMIYMNVIWMGLSPLIKQDKDGTYLCLKCRNEVK